MSGSKKRLCKLLDLRSLAAKNKIRRPKLWRRRPQRHIYTRNHTVAANKPGRNTCIQLHQQIPRHTWHWGLGSRPEPFLEVTEASSTWESTKRSTRKWMQAAHKLSCVDSLRRMWRPKATATTTAMLYLPPLFADSVEHPSMSHHPHH